VVDVKEESFRAAALAMMATNGSTFKYGRKQETMDGRSLLSLDVGGDNFVAN
jgi:hypothetical protein